MADPFEGIFGPSGASIGGFDLTALGDRLKGLLSSIRPSGPSMATRLMPTLGQQRFDPIDFGKLIAGPIVRGLEELPGGRERIAAMPGGEAGAIERGSTAANMMLGLAPFGAPRPAGPKVQPALLPPNEVSTVPAGNPAASPSAEEVLAPRVPMPEKAGNINLQRINSSDDVLGAMANIGERYSSQIDEARRGTVTFDAMKQTAKAMGMTPETLLSRKAGEALPNAETMLASRDLLVASADDLVKSARDIVAGGGDHGIFAERLGRHLAVQEQVSGATAEAGRMLGQFKIMSDAGRRAEALSGAIKAAGGPEKIDAVAKALADIGDDVGAVSRFAREIPAATTSDKLYFAWLNSILSGPPTHAANILGNTGNLLLSTVERGMSEAAGRVGLGKGVVPGETAALIGGEIRGLGEGLYGGIRTMLMGDRAGTGAMAKVAENVRPEPVKMLRGPAGALLPTRALAAEDAIFRSIAYRGELNAQAVRVARGEGLRGPALGARAAELRSEPTMEMLKAAEDAANAGTFTAPLNETGKAFQNFVRETPGARWIMPFVRTPANIFKAGVARSPLAPATPTFWRAMKEGGAARQTAIAKVVTGSAMATAAASATLDGRMTGSGPSNPADRRVWLQNNQSFSIKVGDQWVSYSRLEPFATTIGSVSDAVAAWKLAQTDDPAALENAADSLVNGIADQLTSKTFVSGGVRFMSMLMDPDRFGEQWLQGTLASVVPNVVAKGAQAVDPTLRDTKSIPEAVQARVPGQREELPAKLDIFGKPIQPQAAMSPLERFVSPINRRPAIEDPVASELQRLGYGIGKPHAGEGETRAELGQRERILGGVFHDVMGKLVGTDAWKALNDDDKRDAIGDLRAKISTRYRKAREATEATPVQPQGGVLRMRNNPGNLRGPGGVGFQSFASVDEGIRGASNVLDRYGMRGVNTIATIIGRWAPPHENDTPRYIAAVSQRTGIPPNTRIDVRNPDVKVRILSAIFAQEGAGAPSRDAIARALHQ